MSRRPQRAAPVTAAGAAAATDSDAAQLKSSLQQQLAELASSEVARGQDAYFKGAIRHRGIKAPDLDAACKAFLRGGRTPPSSPAALRQAGLALLREPLHEDKVAGMNLLAHYLLKCGGASGWRQELAALEAVYAGGHVYAWSTSDGICGRVLAPLIKQLLKAEPRDGEACSRAVLAWSRHSNLWLRRSSVVAFVTLARHSDERVFHGFRAALLEALALTVQGPERFAQTGTGWVLRELGKGDAACMLQFVEANLPRFSAEGLRYALEQQPAAERQRLLQAHKAALAGAAAEAEPGEAGAQAGAKGGAGSAAAKRRRRG